MRGLKKEKEMIRFSGRRHPKRGIISAILGIAVTIGFCTMSILSGLNEGESGILFGFLGLLLFGIAIYGTVLSYKVFKEHDIFYSFPIIGIILNGIMTIVFLVLYVLGIGLSL